MSWAQRLRHIFKIDVTQCSECGGEVRVIALIEGPAVIGKILDHLDSQQSESSSDATAQPDCRGPPQRELF